VTRGRAAALAILVLGVLALLLFLPRPAERIAEDGVSAQRPPSVSMGDTPEAVAPGDVPRAVPGKGSRPGKDEDPAQPTEPLCAVTCALEDGTPVAGAMFTFAAVKGFANATRSAFSGPTGEAAIPRGRSAMVGHPHAEPVSADGGTLSPGERGGFVVRGDGDRMRVTFRDKPGMAHVRLVNAETGEPVAKVDGIHVKWHMPGGWMSLDYGSDTAPGGWIPVPEGRLPEGGPEAADLQKVEIEFAMPGFEKARLPLRDVRGRMEVRVRPVPPDATGKVVSVRVPEEEAPGEGEEFPLFLEGIESQLRWTGPDPAPPTEGVLGLPRIEGPFALYNLAPGPWVLEVTATREDNTVVRGKAEFVKGGGTADIGTIELRPGGRVSLRVVDAAGEAIPQAWAVVLRPEENVDQARRLDLDREGTVQVGDLEPDVAHRVVVKGLPREMEQSVVAAVRGKPVEFRWTDRLVPCRISLSVDGKAVANPDGRTTIPAVVQESPLPRDKGAWKPDGTFEAKLVPGTYRFSALATPKEGGDLALFAGEVTVPPGESFEARLELERGKR
jgi:hypothetical protein